MRPEFEPGKLPRGTRSTAGGLAQTSESAFGPDGPELISDGDQVFDRDAATVDRVASNPQIARGDRRRFNIRRFLANLRK